MEEKILVKLDYAARPPKPSAIRMCAGAVFGALAGLGVAFIICELIWGFVIGAHQLPLPPPLMDTVRSSQRQSMSDPLEGWAILGGCTHF